MYFEMFKKELSRYKSVVKGATTYYMKDGKVVATGKKNIIVMYFSCPESDHRIIWNHFGIVAVAIAKNFRFVKDLTVLSQATVVAVDGLCGAANTIKRHNSMLLEYGRSHTLPYAGELGTVGYTNQRGCFHFYDSNLTLTVPHHMCEFDGDALNYSVLEEKEVFTKKKKRKMKPKTILAKNYKVYDYLRYSKNWTWYYTTGYNNVSSPKIREMIDMTKSQNFHHIAKAVVNR